MERLDRGPPVRLTDSIAQQQSLGVYAIVGADVKVVPWLTAGLGVSYEHFDTKNINTNLHTISDGVGSFTHLDYDTALAPGVAGQFGAWRLLGGANLTGVWRDGDWRFQPAATIYYGAENQNSYTTTVGSVAVPQNIPFGCISMGSEVGYAFHDSARSMVIEPFIKARGNFDYVTSNIAIFNGATFTSSSRAQWSASLSAGAVLNTTRGFFARVEASNESVGLNGLSVWLGQLRGGWNF